MPRSRSRSRGGRYGDDNKPGSVTEAAKSGNSEQEIVSVAIKQLSPDIRGRLQKLFEEGLLKEGDLDLRSITVFASLNEGLQARVMNHMEGERIYVANARSKSGFLIATCDKAKTGCLDARGLGAIDPWRTALLAMATPKQRQCDLKPEREWLDKHEEGAMIKIQVNLGSQVEAELGVPNVTVELPLTETSAAIKAKLTAMGVQSIPSSRMKLNIDPLGFIKDGHSFAFYNLEDGVTCTLSERTRGGSRFRRDHTVMPKRPKTLPPPGEAAAAAKTEALAAAAPAPAAATQPAPAPSPLEALKNLAAANGQNMPKLPGLAGVGALPGLPSLGGLMPRPGMPGLSVMPKLGADGKAAPMLPGLAGLHGLGATLPGLAASMPGGLAGLAGLAKAGMPGGPGPAGMMNTPAGLPKVGGPGGGMLNLPGLPMGGGGLPGLPPPGADPKAAAMAFMAKMQAATGPAHGGGNNGFNSMMCKAGPTPGGGGMGGGMMMMDKKMPDMGMPPAAMPKLIPAKAGMGGGASGPGAGGMDAGPLMKSSMPAFMPNLGATAKAPPQMSC